MAGNKVIRYSEAFKRQVVAELEDGTLANVTEAQRRYGFGRETVKNWLRRFGRNHLLPKVVRVEKPGEMSEVQAMRQRVRDLEHALAETRMRELLAEGHFRAVCEREGWDAEAEKKKLCASPSATPGPAASRKKGSR